MGREWVSNTPRTRRLSGISIKSMDSFFCSGNIDIGYVVDAYAENGVVEIYLLVATVAHGATASMSAILRAPSGDLGTNVGFEFWGVEIGLPTHSRSRVTPLVCAHRLGMYLFTPYSNMIGSLLEMNASMSNEIPVEKRDFLTRQTRFLMIVYPFSSSRRAPFLPALASRVLRPSKVVVAGGAR